MENPGNILSKRFKQHGLGGIIQAGQICLQAEKILPGLYQAISVRKNKAGKHILFLSISKGNLKQFKLQEGTLFDEINNFCSSRKYPAIDRLQLTFIEDSDNI